MNPPNPSHPHSQNKCTQLAEYVLNTAIRAGVQAVIERVDKSQVAKLLEIIWGLSDDESIEVTILHILRQRKRNEIRRNTARYLIEGLMEIKKCIQEPKQAKAEAVRFLGTFKWVYEASQGERLYNIDISKLNFEKFIEIINQQPRR